MTISPRFRREPSPSFTVIPQWIDNREWIEDDGAGHYVRLGLSKTDASRLKAVRIDLYQAEDDPIIERYQKLEITPAHAFIEDWGKYGKVRIIEGDAAIVPYVPKSFIKVDGISAHDCRRLEELFGRDFAAVIAKDPSVLSATRFSKGKQAIIGTACKDEVKAAKADDGKQKAVVNALCAVGVAKGHGHKPDSGSGTPVLTMSCIVQLRLPSSGWLTLPLALSQSSETAEILAFAGS